MRGSAFSPSISTSSALPSRGGAPVCAHRPSLAGASARELAVAAQAPHVVMDHRALDPVADGGVEAVEERDPHGLLRTR